MIASPVRKWRAMFSTYFQDSLAYRASGFIWVLTDTVPALILPTVWLRAYGGRSQIEGFEPSMMVMYYLAAATVTNFITCHLMWDIATEIKEGIFSTYLLRPVSYFQVNLIRNLSWRIMRLSIFMPCALFLFWFYRDYVHWERYYFGWEVWAAVLLGHLVSFTFNYAMAMIALWVQEVYSMFELYYIPMLFLSGQLMPLAMLPGWAQWLSVIFPFRYTIALPAELMVGKLSPSEALPQLGMQVLWIGISVLLGRFLWARGLKHYTGVGM